MSVRERKRRDRKTGAVTKVWMIDIVFEHPDGKTERVRKVSPIQTKRGAQQYERELRQAIQTGQRNTERSDVPLFKAFATEFMQVYAATNNKPSERAQKESHLEQHLVPTFGSRRLDEVDVREIERFKANLTVKGLAAKTVNNILSTLRKLLGTAVEWGQVETAPKVKPLKVGAPDFDFLTFDEAAKLVEADGDALWRLMILVGLRTGLRHGELLALRWDDVDLAGAKVRVRTSLWRDIIGTPKNGREREVPLGEEVLAALKSYRQLRHIKGGFVWVNPDGSHLRAPQCRKPISRACAKAGLRSIGWHVLRHTFASHLAMKGVSIRQIQELLGHQSIAVTMRYAHLSPGLSRDAVRLLDGTGCRATAP